ncbi:MAG: hypothetical protein ABI760_24590 [Ferruginibacter sp.]
MKDNEKITALLQMKSAQVLSAAELLMSKTRDWQVIKQFLSNRLNDIILTKDQEKKLNRYQYIYNQLASARYTKLEVINQVQKLYSISVSQVYDDINCTQEIFSTVININKLFEIQLELESAKDMKRKCIEVSDIKTAALVQKNIIALQAMLPDDEQTPGEDFEGHTFEPVFDPRLLGSPEIDMNELLAAINAKRKVKIKTDLFQDIPFDQTSDEEKNSL